MNVLIPNNATLAQALRLIADAAESSDIPGTGGPDPKILAFYNAAGTITLPATNHIVPKTKLLNDAIGYFLQIATLVGSSIDKAGALAGGNAAYYDIGKMSDPYLNAAVQIDAFANPEAYGIGSGGSPTYGPGTGFSQGTPLAGEHVVADGVNTAWAPSSPKQVQYVLVQQDGLYSAVCDNAVPVYGGIGFPPGVATFDDLLGTVAGSGAKTQVVELPVKAGQFFCFAHEGNPGNRFRVSGRHI